MLPLDLTVLRDPKRFESMCFQLARYEFPHVVPTGSSWDGGRDLIVFGQTREDNGDTVFQCKFSSRLSAIKPKIVSALDGLLRCGRQTAFWILCLPVDPSEVFLNWLYTELKGRGLKGTVWGRSELLTRLEQHPDILETYFYSLYAGLASRFRRADIQPFRLNLHPRCQWMQPDRKILAFWPRKNVHSPDLVFDIILRNTGSIGIALTDLEAEIFDRHVKMHGIPDKGLLFPKITYSVSIRFGRPGVYAAECEPPLLIRGSDLQRFRIRITETGYAWNGGLRLRLRFGEADGLDLPALRIFA